MKEQKRTPARVPGLAVFSWYNIPKQEKSTKWPQKFQNGRM
jgi:hypothetical protein